MRVLISGGGIGGLCLALALRQRGIEVRVFERATDLAGSQVGAGLTLAYNATRVLRGLGLGAELATLGCPYKTSEFRTPQGALLARWSVPNGELQLGVVRAHLHQMLMGALGEDVLSLGASCLGFQQDEDGVTLQLADGREVRGDVLVGADGLHSVIRPRLLGPETPRYAGYAVWRGLSTLQHEDAPPGLFRMWWGAGKRFAFYVVASGLIYWFGVIATPAGQSDPRGTRQRRLLERYDGWPPLVGELLSATPETNIHHTDIYDRAPVRRWGEGRVTLLGDAAHPMTFNLGQGACQAMESAWVLAQCLSGGGDPVAALRAYERQRMPRTARYTRVSWGIGALGRWKHPGAVWLRDHGLKLAFERFIVPREEKSQAIELTAWPGRHIRPPAVYP
jgi:2-polyprenyl-6-methoxyphenol hydroxylase-like FAD-dependent oxidoreductase